MPTPAPAITPIRLLAGLGNPGREYAGTRHNVGWMILDRLAASAGARFVLEKKWRAEVARVHGLWLVKPQTFMNLSGEAVGAVASFYRIAPAECLAFAFADVELSREIGFFQRYAGFDHDLKDQLATGYGMLV